MKLIWKNVLKFKEIVNRTLKILDEYISNKKPFLQDKFS